MNQTPALPDLNPRLATGSSNHAFADGTSTTGRARGDGSAGASQEGPPNNLVGELRGSKDTPGGSESTSRASRGEQVETLGYQLRA